LALARAASQVYVAKGKKVVHLDLKRDQPSDDQLLALLLGPSGNLRAPTMRTGKVLLVGFEPEAFGKLLG
jgi:arsenate reductase-like glutaredoxin family protein